MEQLPLFLLTIWPASYLDDTSNYLLPTVAVDSVWLSKMTWAIRYLQFSILYPVYWNSPYVVARMLARTDHPSL